MRITAAQIFKCDDKIENWMFIKVETDSGINGYGEISSSPLIAELVAHKGNSILKNIINKNPLDFNSCLKELKKWSNPYFASNIIFTTILSGIDQALWDINAKSQNKPLYELLGGKTTKIKMYANLNRAIRKNREDILLYNNAKLAMNAGFEGVKIAPFDEIQPDMQEGIDFERDIAKAIERINEVSKIAGQKNVAIDCHQRFNMNSADKFLNALSKSQVIPTYVEDLLSYSATDCCNLKKLKEKYPYFVFAAGETCTSLQKIKELISYDCYSIFNPDVKFVGGVTELVKICDELNDKNLIVMPHNPTSPIATAFTAAIISRGKTSLLEFPYGNQESRESFLGEKEDIENGYYSLSEESGIGIEPCLDFLNSDVKIFKNGEWGK